MCPGRTGKKCGVFMSPLIRDPHIHCPRCRGNKCTIDNTCIICKSWPPEQWDLFSKKKSYALSKARRGRSVSMSASPAPSVVGTSVRRPSVPPASPPASRDQVVMGGQTSVGVSVGCLGSTPSGSVTMATGYISDDVVAASPVPPPASGGEGGQEKLPPACSLIPGPSSSRLLSPGRREKRVDPSGSSHAGPPRSPSTERERGGKRRCKRSRSPSFPSRYRSRSTSGERRERGSRYRQRSRERRDHYSDMKRSRRSLSLSPFRRHSEQRSRSRSRHFYSERSHDHRDSREYRPRDSPKRSLYRSRSREPAYRSRTPSERGDHAERCGKGATLLLGRKKKRSDVSAVRHMIQSVMSGFQKSLEAFGDNASNSSSAGASSRGTPSPRGELPAKSVSSARQGGASSSRARASSFRASQLTKALIDDVSAHVRNFGEDQTQGAFLPIPGRRSRRFYRTSEPLFPVPYQIPPGVAPLVQESSTDVKRRPTTFSPSLSSSQEVLLSSACETTSWIDLALPACSNFGSRLPADSKPEFERMRLSVGRAVEFLASQVVTALGNHVLAKRDSLLRDPQSMVPVEALSRLRHDPLPSLSAAIFPTPLLDEALSKSRASANDALVKKSLHPPRIPKKVSSGQGRSLPRTSSVDRGGESPVTPHSQGSSQHQRSSNSGHRGKKSRRGGQAKGNRSNNNRGSGRKGGGKRHS